MKCSLTGLRSGDWLVQNIQRLCLRKSITLLSIYAFGQCEVLSNEFWSKIWADDKALHTSEFSLLLSAVTSSINTNEPAPFTDVHAYSIMKWYHSDHEQILLFSIILSCHYSSTRWSLSHLPIGCYSRSVQGFFYWKMLICSSCIEAFQCFFFCAKPSLYSLVKSDFWLWYAFFLCSALDQANCLGVFYTKEWEKF